MSRKVISRKDAKSAKKTKNAKRTYQTANHAKLFRAKTLRAQRTTKSANKTKKKKAKKQNEPAQTALSGDSHPHNNKSVTSPGIEPGSEVPETSVLSVVLRSQYGRRR